MIGVIHLDYDFSEGIKRKFYVKCDRSYRRMKGCIQIFLEFWINNYLLEH